MIYFLQNIAKLTSSIVYGAEGDDLPQRAQTVSDVTDKPGALTPKGKWPFEAFF